MITVNLQNNQFAGSAAAVNDFVKEEVVITTGAAASSGDSKDELTIKPEPFDPSSNASASAGANKLETISPNKTVVKASPNKQSSSADATPVKDDKGAENEPPVPVTPSVATTTRVNGKPVIKFPPEYLRDKLIGMLYPLYVLLYFQFNIRKTRKKQNCIKNSVLV